jgi:hypothetical protein
MEIEVITGDCVTGHIVEPEDGSNPIGFSARSNDHTGWVRLTVGQDANSVSFEGKKEELQKLVADMQEVLNDMTEPWLEISTTMNNLHWDGNLTCVEIDKTHRHVTLDDAGRPAIDGYCVPDTVIGRAQLQMALQADDIAGFAPLALEHDDA